MYGCVLNVGNIKPILLEATTTMCINRQRRGNTTIKKPPNQSYRIQSFNVPRNQ